MLFNKTRHLFAPFGSALDRICDCDSLFLWFTRSHLSANIIGKCFFGFAFLQWHYYDFIMKVLKVITWSGYKKYQEALMNAEGRLSICINDPKVRIDRITIEPNDPDSKVQFTHYGAKYTCSDDNS